MAEPLTPEQLDTLRAIHAEPTPMVRLLLATIDADRKKIAELEAEQNALVYGHNMDGSAKTHGTDLQCPECGTGFADARSGCSTCGASISFANYSACLAAQDARLKLAEDVVTAARNVRHAWEDQDGWGIGADELSPLDAALTAYDKRAGEEA